MKLTEEQARIAKTAAKQLSGEPVWWEDEKLDEVAFCDWLLGRHEMKYVGTLFYDIDGQLSEQKLSREIMEYIEPYVKCNVSVRIKRLIDLLKIKCAEDKLPVKEDRIHFANGTYHLEDGSFTVKEFCSNRLEVAYNPEAPEPKQWLSFLNQLLYPEDIVTLQEFMGYCFIPTTKAQCMLMLIGNGGEGKSRIGLVMRNLLGDNMNVCSIAKLATNKYCPADQEGKLLMVDDDAKMEALTETNMLKAIITMEDKMDLEKKRVQSYQGYLYVRIMAFGNGSLTSLYDKSDGFYRRQIIIVVKDRNPGRIDDTSLSKKLKAESEGIALWCLEGLKKLVVDDFHFTISDKAKLALEDTKREGDNILEFLDSEGYIHFQEDMEISAKDLYEIYIDWCMDNCEKARAQNSFSKAFKVYAEKRGLEYQKNLKLSNGKRCRGYKGLCRHPGENPFTRSA